MKIRSSLRTKFWSKMYSIEDLECFYFSVSNGGVASWGVCPVVLFKGRRFLITNYTRNKVVEVQVDGVPEITP